MSRLNGFMSFFEDSVFHSFCEEHGVVKKYARGERMVREGELCRHIGVVKKGYFKFCALSSAGEERITGFSFKGELVTDYVRSFLEGKPSYCSIVAGCDSEVMQVPLTEIRSHILECHPDFVAKASSLLLHEAYRRYLDIHVMTPAERYEALVARYPAINADLPFQEIASYLGVSRRQLHRIRKKLLKS